ncbi:PAS domain-containing sensor histidine kinase [Robiginitalea marina]|uniref:histidine kinase n=1 Tax=Robiginitalea marina TaxID=2954105 RepID=A0ABT1AZ48_9FLAO|nr:PAS domain-containing sensor histidine kinase [Robiginitalea marina]MCO5724872.1 PAS domain-containing protein [Robiginitalea marina]
MRQQTDLNLQGYLIKQLPVPTAFLDRELRVVLASDSWVSTFGWSRAEVIGRTFRQLFPDAPKALVRELRDCLSGSPGAREIVRHEPGPAKDTCLEWHGYPWFDRHENIAGVILQTREATREVRMELEYEKMKQLLEVTSEVSRIGSWEYLTREDYLHWSPMTRKIHDVGDDFTPSLQDAINFYKEGYSRNAISMAVYRAMETGQPWREKLQLITAAGKEIWVIAAGKALFREGTCIGLIGTFQDVTEATLAEMKIRESELLLSTLVDNLPLNVYIKDLESRKVLVNKAECQFLGARTAAELIGKSDFDLYEREVAETSREEDLYVMNNRASLIGKETVSVRPDGTMATLLTSKIPLIDHDNKVYGLMGIGMDISHLKEKEDELRRLIDITSRQNKKLVDFAHIVSHNLRSHTANFSMLLDFLVGETDASEKAKITEMLQQASSRLQETLENLNTVVAINTNHIHSRKKRVSLGGKVDEVEKKLAGFLNRNQALLIREIPENTTVKVVPQYLESILTHLVSNAVKYRHPDRDPVIRMTCERLPGYQVLNIEDNGLGMDLEKYGDKLFGMHKTFHEHPDARGLGLFLTKNQMEAMNGKIRVMSREGKGSTFKIYFHEED